MERLREADELEMISSRKHMLSADAAGGRTRFSDDKLRGEKP